jgi:hypothetical protein
MTAALAFATVAPGQTTSQTFHLNVDQSPSGINELTTLVRVLGVNTVHADDSKMTITVSGTSAELALAAWLIEQLDSTDPRPAVAQYTVNNDLVRIFFLAHTPPQAPLNELVTVLRTVADVQRIFTYTARRAIALRAPASNAQLAEWLTTKLDVAPDAHAATEHVDFPLFRCATGLVEVAFLSHPVSQMGLNELVTTLRSVGDIQKIFTHSSQPQAVVFASCDPQAHLADWLFQQIDVRPDAQMRAEKHEYVMPNSDAPVARVYYLNPGSQSPRDLIQTIRSVAKVQRIFFCDDSQTLSLRATPDLVAIADRLVQERNQ